MLNLLLLLHVLKYGLGIERTTYEYNQEVKILGKYIKAKSIQKTLVTFRK